MHFRLDYFLVFFQNYYWFKKSDPIFSSIENNSSDLFPILTDHYFKECLLAIRPKLKLYKNYEQAKEEVEKLQQELYPNLFSENSEGDALGTIAEEGNEQTDTNNDNTEDTSEAFGSDDEVRKRYGDEDENENSQDEDGTDAGIEAMDDVRLELNKNIEEFFFENKFKFAALAIK